MVTATTGAESVLHGQLFVICKRRDELLPPKEKGAQRE